jgi:hypothetical protein
VAGRPYLRWPSPLPPARPCQGARPSGNQRSVNVPNRVKNQEPADSARTISTASSGEATPAEELSTSGTAATAAALQAPVSIITQPSRGTSVLAITRRPRLAKSVGMRTTIRAVAQESASARPGPPRRAVGTSDTEKTHNRAAPSARCRRRSAPAGGRQPAWAHHRGPSQRQRYEPAAYPLSHPIPSLSPSNPCGSGGSTRNLRWGMSAQSRSGGVGLILAGVAALTATILGVTSIVSGRDPSTPRNRRHRAGGCSDPALCRRALVGDRPLPGH